MYFEAAAIAILTPLMISARRQSRFLFAFGMARRG